ncbi:MAG: hypothetical protein IJS09_00315 [Treponema sp.]|nr:hypothetical protein [Treponema sp.]
MIVPIQIALIMPALPVCPADFNAAVAISSVVIAMPETGLFELPKAFANHFKIRAEEQIIKNRVALYDWLRKLFLGILVLGFFLLLARLFRVDAAVHPFLNILSEGFGIVGWVALWEPATYFLYGHNEGRELLLSYMKLHRATVTIQNISD